VGEDIVTLPARGSKLPPQAQVQRELLVHPEVVLKIEEVIALAVIAHQPVGELNLTGKSEREVGQIVAGAVVGNRAASRLSELRARRLAELAGITLKTVYRIDVHHQRVNDVHLGAELQSVAAHHP